MPEKGELVADCILEGLEKKDKADCVIGFGGGHYTPMFSKKEKEFAFGHMCAKYALDDLDTGLVAQMAEKTIGNVAHAFVDSGMKSRHKKKIFAALGGLGIEY